VVVAMTPEVYTPVRSWILLLLRIFFSIGLASSMRWVVSSR
jgi:hypothetical protein